jgi:ABC-type dipeptide/oligopeptide/nickel transport system ATPase subunit
MTSASKYRRFSLAALLSVYSLIHYIFQGEVIGITGPVGSGKSALLSALLGQVYNIVSVL